jgi:chorismate synthase
MNQFGHIFRIQLFGESHGPYVGVVIDGCPAGISLKESDFTFDVERRRSGKRGTTSRTEDDIPQIISGVFQNKTSGSPLTILFNNKNIKSQDYKNIIKHPRPGHADFTTGKKFNGFNDPRGSGHFSGRLTLPLIAAGIVAKKIINPVIIKAELIEAGGNVDIDEAIEQALSAKESVGGIVECNVKYIPVGWGEPFFNSVESTIAHLAFAIPGVKGIEFGLGFESSKITGSKMNDLFINKNGKTSTNNSGGILGGISNGNDINFRIAIKPTSSISKPQETFHFENKKIQPLFVEGRHDTCIALRVPVIAEAITAIALADFKLLAAAYN